MSSALTDADQDAGLRESIARAGFAGWYGRDEYDEHPVQGMWERAADAIMRGPLATLRARATAAEAERDSMVAWAKSATHACDKAYIAPSVEEDNLIALAKMYGEACGRMVALYGMYERLGEDNTRWADDCEDFWQRLCAAEHRLKDREAEIERLREALAPFAAVCSAEQMKYVRDEQVLELATRAEVPVSEKLRGMHFRAARAALASTEPHARSEEATDAQ